MSKILVIDTNILISACPELKSHSSKASAFVWDILEICHCIAIDEMNMIMDIEYKKYMRNNQTLTAWMRYMRLKKKIKYRSGTGYKIDGLKEMDNIFACVSIRTPDRIFITENARCFNSEVKKILKKYGVKVLSLDQGFEYIHGKSPS